MHSCNPKTWEVQASRLWVQGQPWSNNVFDARIDTNRFYLKKKIKTQQKEQNHGAGFLPKKAQATVGQYRRCFALGTMKDNHNHTPTCAAQTGHSYNYWEEQGLVLILLTNGSRVLLTGKRQTAQMVKNIHKFLTVNMRLEAFTKICTHTEPPHRCVRWLYSQWPQTGDNSHVLQLVTKETDWVTPPVHQIWANNQKGGMLIQ